MSFGEFWRINAVVIAVLVAILSLTPDPNDLGHAASWTEWLARLILGDPTSADKIAHFLAYGALGFFVTLGWLSTKRTLLWIVVGLIGYGAALEVLQAVGGSRTGDIFDLLANTIGAASGVIGAIIAQWLVARTGLEEWTKQKRAGRR